MSTTTDNVFRRLTNVYADMVEQETHAVVDLLGAFSDTLQSGSVATLGKGLQRLVPTQLTRRSACACEIPPPCWMPQAAGEVTSFVCAGGSATVQIQVTNCTMGTRRVHVQATGPDGENVTVTPAQLELGPLERGTVSASLAVPADGKSGHQADVILWVRGCRTHYVRWSVRTAARGATCSHEVEIEDCQEQVHHWYDHFYCERPCLPERVQQGG